MIIDETQNVWFKKYMPQQVEDVLLPDKIKKQIQTYISNERIPHLGLFSSIPGTGKSSLANAIIRDLGSEAMWINASLDNGINELRGKLSKFASQTSFDDRIKVVVMDEFDHFSTTGQAGFRGFIDEFSDNCLFIFTGNYKEKIIQPMLDRMEVYDFNSFSQKDMVKPIFERLQFILTNEGIEFDPKDLIPVINTYYPSVRSMVGALQKFSDGTVFKVSESELDNLDAFGQILGFVKAKNFKSMVDNVNKTNAPDNMYSYLYTHMEEFKEEVRPRIVLTIAKYQHMSASVRDKNLNLSACLSEIMMTI